VLDSHANPTIFKPARRSCHDENKMGSMVTKAIHVAKSIKKILILFFYFDLFHFMYRIGVLMGAASKNKMLILFKVKYLFSASLKCLEN
jgi:hypothetical protein